MHGEMYVKKEEVGGCEGGRREGGDKGGGREKREGGDEGGEREERKEEGIITKVKKGEGEPPYLW